MKTSRKLKFTSMKKLFFLFLLSFLLLSNRSNAQASLGISQYDYVIANDTVAAYSTSDSIGFYVINRGSTVFNDIFRVYMAVQDSIGSSFHNVDTAYYVFPALKKEYCRQGLSMQEIGRAHV